MQIVIDTMQCPCRTLNDECDISGGECYEDDICSPCPLIRNGGIKLPKGHGRLGDLDAVMDDINRSIEGMTNIGIMVDGEYLWGKLNDAIYNASTIIEADKESEGYYDRQRKN